MDENSQECIQRWASKRAWPLVVSILKGETSVQEAFRRHGLTVAEAEAVGASSFSALRTLCALIHET
ncbi:hypothetical protein PCS_03530 [Desulfocurvibacter africanus PCS]|uniref:Uncharacterized protein n=1 Tax=Desulfocurvibacter africanus PCS TaxID=1262666 RepID=M5Q0I3_DESAF|nr:hypothetical protein PCS_03530 [Desulfocurvibacter africanus PCS]